MTGLPELIDTHAHLDDRRLRDDLPGVLERARLAGVVQVVGISTTADDSRSVVDFAARHEDLYAAVGIHPNDVAETSPGDWAVIESLVKERKVVAVGETGLDRHWKKTPFDQQQVSFADHLRLAFDFDLPVVIHCRDCMADVIAQLRGLRRPVKGILHSFTGDAADAEALLGLGLHISFAGMLTFANKSLDPLREAARRIPADRILVETDSPYLTPEPFRGKPNEPARVVHTAARLAELRGVAIEDLACTTTSNARRLFGLPNAAPA